MKINTGKLAADIEQEINFMKGVPSSESGTFVAFDDDTLQIQVTVTRDACDFINVGENYEGCIEDPRTPLPPEYDLLVHLRRQMIFSQGAFGPGKRTQGIIDHIKKELIEVESEAMQDGTAGDELEEWIDLVLLALDGAWRCANTVEDVVKALSRKLVKNENRQWPDWRTADPEKAIEHVRGDDSAA